MKNIHGAAAATFLLMSNMCT